MQFQIPPGTDCVAPREIHDAPVKSRTVLLATFVHEIGAPAATGQVLGDDVWVARNTFL